MTERPEELLEALRRQGFRTFSYFLGKGNTIFPLWKPGEWSFGVLTEREPPLEGGEVLFAFAKKRFFRFPFTLKNLGWLREVLPELAPQTLGEKGAVGLEEETLSFFPETFRILWEKDVTPFVHISSQENLEQGILSAVWGAFTGGRKGPFGASACAREKNHLERALRLGYTVGIFDGRNSIRSEAFSWDEKKLADAFFALSPREKETWKRYAERSIRFSEDFVLEFPEKLCLQILLAYFPLLDVLEECFVSLSGQRFSFDFGIFFENLLPEAHFFLAEELHRRGVDFGLLLLGAESREHFLLSQAIQGYRLGFFAEEPILPREGSYVVLKDFGFRSFREVLAREDPKLFQDPLQRETLETLLFRFYEAVATEMRMRLQS
ncbi:MAG: hypothetical protein H5U36_05625 [Candidatus Caldatribacterium sp.]|nr:hypothetical protein [Candidatus Caldatribacterium sp.]